MKKKIILYATFSFIAICVIEISFYLTGFSHMNTALYHNFPDIDDYTIFENRPIKKSNPSQKWSTKSLKATSLKELRPQLEELQSVVFLP